jgi:hypothetical protein
MLVRLLSTGSSRLDIYQLHIDDVVQLNAVLVIEGAKVGPPVEDNLLDLWRGEEIEYAVESGGRERLDIDKVRLRIGGGCAEDDDRQGASDSPKVPPLTVKYEGW